METVTTQRFVGYHHKRESVYGMILSTNACPVMLQAVNFVYNDSLANGDEVKIYFQSAPYCPADSLRHQLGFSNLMPGSGQTPP